jgi:2-succinyl-5-enolpyruvyl-6-hydroxy-3-cyclohexene-1-carboxylate synthase
VAQAVRAALGPTRGPVHLNLPFRDPLPPIPDGSARAVRTRVQRGDFFAGIRYRPEPPPARGDLSRLPVGRRVLVVAGPDDAALNPIGVALTAAIARRHGWPVLADALTGMRGLDPDFPCLVAHYDTVLRNRRLARELVPDAVLCLGGWPTSKVLRAWLQACAPKVWLVSASAHHRDALHLATTEVRAQFWQVLDSLRGVPGDAAYLEQWTRAETAAAARMNAAMQRKKRPFEPVAAWLLARHLPEETPVFLASSMPVRDAEFFWPTNKHMLMPYFNRGANGIDGTLSTALGVAHASRRPAVLLTGDLAFLHDSNGLLLRPKFRGSLTIVLINNRGGGIFEHLPVAQFPEAFEEFFATPQETDMAGLCTAHGVDHVLVRDWPHFTGLIAQLPRQGIRVLEVRTDRRRDAAERKALFAKIAAGL